MKYLVLLLFTILLFLNNDSLALWEQDEAAYAGFAYNMLETGNFIIPDFEWSWPHRKPPFHFWMIAASYSIFGYTEFATRIPSVLAILFSLILVYYFSKRLYSQKLANWASLVFMGSLLLPVYGKIGMTDATLVFCFIGSYFSVLSYLESKKNQWLWWLLFFTSIGVLTKGPPILITTLGSLGLAFVLGKERREFLKLLIFSIVSLIPFIIWAGLSWHQDGGEFLLWWVDWYILKRTTGTVNNHTGFIGYYLLIFILCFLPWMLFLPHALKRLFLDFIKREKSSQLLFQSTWLISGWLFYEVLTSKLPSYAFAVLPIWFIYIAQSIINFKTNSSKFIRYSSLALGVFFIIVGFGIFVFKNKIPFDNLELTYLLVICLLFIFGVLYLIQIKIPWLQHRLPEIAFIFAFGLHLIAWGIALPAFESTRRFPKTISEKLVSLNSSPKHVYFSADYSMSSLPVYLAWNGYRFNTSPRENYDQHTMDTLRYSRHKLFMLQRRNLHCLDSILDSFKLTTIYGFKSDKGFVDTFFIAERKGLKASQP